MTESTGDRIRANPVTTYEKALLDPTSVFKAPEDVLNWSGLSPGQKTEILRRWEYDARELETAEGEGMANNPPSLLRRVQLALTKIDAEQ